MADERHVTFGGSFKFDDSGLVKANKQIDELLKRGKSVSHMFDDVKGLKGFGSSISDAEKSLNGFDNKFDKFREKANKGIKAKIDFDDDQATRKLDHFKTMSEKIPENKHTKMSVDDNASSKFKDAYEASKKVPKIHETTLKAKNDTKPAFNSFDSSMETSKKHASVFKNVLLGTFAGNLISNGVQALVGGLKSATAAGMAYNKQQDTMKTVWTALTNEAPKDGKKLTNYINDVSQHSIYAAGTIDKMAQSFYHVDSNVGETKNWTKSFVALGSTLHMTDSNLQNAGESFAKIVAGGKANSQDMSTMINQFPMFGEALQKSTGKSMKQLYAMSAAGKLSAKQFTEALDYLGKKYKGGTAEAMTSFQGMSMYIKSRWSVLTGSIMNSSFKLSKGVAHDLQDLMKDDMMKKYARGVSSVVGGAISGISALVKSVDRNKESITAALGTIGRVFGDTFGIAGDAVKMFGTAFMANVDGPVNKSSLADRLGQFQKGFHDFAKAVTPVTDDISGLIGVLSAAVFNNIGSLFRGIGSGLGFASKNGKGLKGTFEGIAKAISPVNYYFNILGKKLEPVSKGIGELVGAIGKQVWQDFATTITTVGKVIGTVADGIGSIFGVKNGGALKALGDLLDSIAKNKVAVQTVSWALTGLLTTKMVTGGMSLLGTYSGKLIDIASHFKLIKKNADEASASEVIANSGGSGGSVGNSTRAGSTHYTNAKNASRLTTVGDAAAGAVGIASTVGRSGAQHMAPGKLAQFGKNILSKLGSSKLAGVAEKVGSSKLGTVAKVAGKGLSKIPVLDVLAASSTLIGTTKKNVGSHLGNFGGTLGGMEAGGLAGAAIPVLGETGIGEIGGSIIGGMAGSSLGKKAGGAIQKGLGKINMPKMPKLSNPFKGFKVPNIASMFTKAIGKVPSAIGGAWRKVTSTISGWGKSIGKFFSPVTKVFGSFVKTVGKVLKPVGRALQLALVIPIALVVGLAIKAWQKMEKPFKTVAKVIGGVVKDVAKSISGAWKGISKSVGSFNGKVVKTVSSGWSKVKKSTSSAWNSVKNFVVKPVKAIGSAVNRYIVKNLVKAVSGAWSKVKKSTSSAWNAIKKYVVNPVESLYKTVTGKFSSLFKGIRGVTSSFGKWFSKTWGDIKSNTVGLADDIWKGVTKKFNKMANSMADIGSNIKKSWHSLWNGLSSFFGDIWTSIGKKAHAGFGKVVGVLNTGIGGIDKVIHAFGGSSKAIATIKFASGTGALSGPRRPITKPTFSMLNDGNDSPETGNREVAVLPNGQAFSPQERNWTGLLPAGTEVLNARESAAVFGTQRFAKGTGLLGTIGGSISNIVSGAVKTVSKGASWLKNLFSTATSIIKHPIKSFENLFKFNDGGAKGIFQQIGKGAFNKVAKVGKNWWSNLWSMVDLNGGSSAGGNWAHSPGLSETNGFGAKRSFGTHDGVDFSGPLGSAILAVHGGTITQTGAPGHGWPESQLGKVITVKSSDGYQEIYQEFGGTNNIKVKSGDEIHTGQKIATLGALHGAGSGSHVHIGVSKGSLWNHGGSSTKGWYDVTKMHGSSDGSGKKSKKSDNKGIKAQVGAGFWKTISKIASLFGDDGGGASGNPGGSGVQRWKSDVKKALGALGLSTSVSMVARVLRQINTESGGNPKAMGGTDGLSDGRAMGLMQVKPGTLKAYGKSSLGGWSNGYSSIYTGLNYAKHRYGSGLSFLGNGHGYAMGGEPSVGVPALVGEKGAELIVPKQQSKVIPHGKSKTLLNNLKRSVDVHPTINMNITATDAEDIKKKAGDIAKSIIEKMFGDLANGISDSVI